MTGEEIYKIYAPNGAKWAEWVRPVPFIAIDTYNREPIVDWVDRRVFFLKEYEQDAAIFIDLPGKESIELSIALASIGYRPIPLFNGTDEQINAQATNNTYWVECCLINGGQKLKNIFLSNNANPAFVLDSLRTNRYRAKDSIYDNSWDLYKQDIPTAEYFINSGIKKIIIVGNTIQRDLKKIFYDFQLKKIEIYLTDGYALPKRIMLKKTIKEKLEKEEF